MTSNSSPTCPWRGSARRVALHVAVASLHAGFVMFLLRDFSGLKQRLHRDSPSAGGALHIRFVRHVVTAEMPAPLPPRLPHRLGEAPPRATGPTPPHALSPPVAAVATPAPAADGATSREAADQADYIAGGNLLHGSSILSRSQRIRLPGSDVPVVRNLHMIDPRMQGVAGVVRTMQAIFNVPNPHCIDVDAWRGLTVRELLDRHMSPDEVEMTARKYHCGPPR